MRGLRKRAWGRSSPCRSARRSAAAVEALRTEGRSSSTARDAVPEALVKGAFMAPVLLRARAPSKATLVHHVEPFGPVATVLAYETLDDAINLVAKGEGSLVASVYTHDDGLRRTPDPWPRAVPRPAAGPRPRLRQGVDGPRLALAGAGPWRSRPRRRRRRTRRPARRVPLHAADRAAGIARAPGGADPALDQGRARARGRGTPVRRHFEALEIGDTVESASRTITLDDIEHFAHFTGDTFYAHMDEEAAKANPFFPGRVAHGYLLLSFAAGLFVDPAPGPLLANYGLDNLRFLKPVSPGDAIRVRLTVKQKQAARKPEYGEVRWDVELFNQDGDTVAQYELLTMSARKS